MGSMSTIKTLRTVEIHVDQNIIALYADVTNDYNPLHVDPEFAAKSPFGGVIAHGTMSLNLIWQAVAATFRSAEMLQAVLDVRFKSPVRIGDTIIAGGDREQDGSYVVWARNQSGVNVIEGILRLAELARRDS